MCKGEGDARLPVQPFPLPSSLKCPSLITSRGMRRRMRGTVQHTRMRCLRRFWRIAVRHSIARHDVRGIAGRETVRRRFSLRATWMK